MAIIIPSKNIYEINNQKVVDNEVDNIEVEAKNVQQKNEYNVVVQETSYDNKNDFVSEQKQENSSIQSASANDYLTAVAVAYASVTPKYLTKTINIPILQNYSYVQKIILGADGNNNPNIRYTLYGTITTEVVNATVHVEKEKFETINDFSFSNSSVSDIKPYELSTNIETDTYSAGGIANPASAKVAFQLDNKSNLATLTEKQVSIEGKDYFQIEATILCGENIIKVGGADSAVAHDRYQLATTDMAVSGTREIYEPTKIEITIYGNTIGIDLKDETVKIGDGQHVYSFSGNELMQTSNTPSIESPYAKIVSDWGDGKELATIKCAIADYYSNEKEKNEIQIKMIRENILAGAGILGEKHVLYFTNNSSSLYTVYKDDRIIINNDTTFRVEETSVRILVAGSGLTSYIYAISAERISGSINYGFEENKIINVDLIHENPKKISMSGKGDYPTQNNLPLTLNIGDSVIPYVMGADGNDKPMSLYSDKTPKEFVIIGKGIIADGEIMQEITAQEKKYTRIKIISIEFGDLQFQVLMGKISIYDLIEYNGQAFLVRGTAQSAKGEETYLLSAASETWKDLSIGQIITTSVIGRDEPQYPTVQIRVLRVRGSGGSNTIHIEISRVTSGEFQIATRIEYQAESATIMEAIPSETGGDNYIILCKDNGVFYGSIGKTITVKQK